VGAFEEETEVSHASFDTTMIGSPACTGPGSITLA
jgi:hypothetical protein